MAKFKFVGTNLTMGSLIDIPEYDDLPPDGILKKLADLIMKSHGWQKV